MGKSTNTVREAVTLRTKILGSTSIAVLGAMMMSSTAFAAETSADNNAPIATNSGIVKMAQVIEQPSRTGSLAAGQTKKEDEIIVEGIKSSLENSIQIKRNADNIVDSISAEGMGRFPDLNLAESIQRIAGVQLIRDDRRSGQVAIRGLSGFTKTQINGQDLASPDFSGGFTYGIFESSVVSGVDVQKTPRVSFDAGGIGGIVNIKTRNALDFEDDKHLYISAKGQYEQLSGALIPDLGLSAGIKNAAGDLGAFVSIGYQERDFRSDAARLTTYRSFDAAGNRLSGSAVNDTTRPDLTFVPAGFRYTSRGVTGERISISGGAEWQASDEFNVTLTGIFANSDSEQPLNQMTVFPNGPRSFNFGQDFIVNSVVDGGALGDTALSVRYISPAIQVQNRILDGEFETWAGTLTSEWDSGPWNVTGTVHHTEGKKKRFLAQIVSRIDSRNVDRTLIDNGLVLDLNTGANNPNEFEIFLNRSPGDIGTFGYNATNGPDTTDHLSARIFGGSSSHDRFEQQSAIQFDVNREVDLPLLASIDFGAKIRQLKQQNRQKRYENDQNLDLSVLDDSFFDSGFISDGQGFLGGQVPFQGLLVPNARRVLDAVGLTELPPGTDLSEVALDENGIPFQIQGGGRFDNTQTIFAAYGSANFGFDAGPIGIRGNAGVRVVDTKRHSETNTLTQSAQRVNGVTVRINNRVAVEADTAFTHVLPQVNMIFDLRDDLVFRASYSETMNRPDPNSIQAGNFIRVDLDELTDEVTRIRAFSDKSQLEPFTADSFDLAFEWYNREGSAVHGAIFTKKVTNFIQVIKNCPATVLGVEVLITGPTAFDSNNVCRDANNVEIAADLRVNTDETFVVKGLEIGATQNLDFLPGFWSNFGFTANYTLLSGDDDPAVPGTTPFSSISKHSFNVIAYYETDTFGIRLANNYRSKFNDGNALGGFAGDARLVAGRTQWDMSGSYNVNDNFKIGFEALNLTDEDRFEFQGIESRFRNLQKEGRTFTLSGSYIFH